MENKPLETKTDLADAVNRFVAALLARGFCPAQIVNVLAKASFSLIQRDQKNES